MPEFDMAKLKVELAKLVELGVKLTDRGAVKAKSFELEMHEVSRALGSISHLKDSKRAQAWDAILQDALVPKDEPPEMTPLEETETPDPTLGLDESPSSESSGESSGGEADPSPTKPSSELGDESPTEPPSPLSETPATDGSTPSGSPDSPSSDTPESEKAE